jgi:hypothetical protein
MPHLHKLTVGLHPQLNLAVHKANTDFVEVAVLDALVWAEVDGGLAAAEVALLGPGEEVVVVDFGGGD